MSAHMWTAGVSPRSTGLLRENTPRIPNRTKSQAKVRVYEFWTLNDVHISKSLPFRGVAGAGNHACQGAGRQRGHQGSGVPSAPKGQCRHLGPRCSRGGVRGCCVSRGPWPHGRVPGPRCKRGLGLPGLVPDPRRVPRGPQPGAMGGRAAVAGGSDLGPHAGLWRGAGDSEWRGISTVGARCRLRGRHSAGKWGCRGPPRLGAWEPMSLPWPHV